MPKVSIIDMIAKKLRRCIAIVEDGDTASQAIASGKFVIWKGNPCTASTAISAGDTLSNSNLTALSDGIGNELNSKITALPLIESKMITAGSGVSIAVQNCILFPNLALFLINAMITVTSPVSAGGTVISLPSGLVASGRTDLQVNGTLLYVPNRAANISVVTGTLAAGTYDISLAMIVTNN